VKLGEVVDLTFESLGTVAFAVERLRHVGELLLSCLRNWDVVNSIELCVNLHATTHFQSFGFLFQFLVVFFSLLEFSLQSSEGHRHLLGLFGVFAIVASSGAARASVLALEEETVWGEGGGLLVDLR
jgi:hypothetical protein